ncbi:unnamed protein product, partial [Lymnaea stagnalis]
MLRNAKSPALLFPSKISNSLHQQQLEVGLLEKFPVVAFLKSNGLATAVDIKDAKKCTQDIQIKKQRYTLPPSENSIKQVPGVVYNTWSLFNLSSSLTSKYSRRYLFSNSQGEKKNLHCDGYRTKHCFRFASTSSKYLNCTPQTYAIKESKQRDEFLKTLSNCATADEILKQTGIILADGNLQKHHLPSLFTKFQTTVYANLSQPWLLDEDHLIRKQLKMNFQSDQLLRPYTQDQRFQQLLTALENFVPHMALDECLLILKALEYLEVTFDFPVVQQLYSKCSDSVANMSLHQLAQLSHCLQSHPPDLQVMGKIADATKCLLTAQDKPDLDFADICEIFRNIKYVVSTDLFLLCARKMLTRMENEPDKITLDMISQTCLFAAISDNVCLEILVNGILNFPSHCLQHIDFNVSSLTFDLACTMNGKLWLCPVLHGVRHMCNKELLSGSNLSAEAVVKLTLGSSYNFVSYSDKIQEILKKSIKKSDNFLLIEMMKHDIICWPANKFLMEAYHERLVKLVTQLNEQQLEELLWQDKGETAYLIYQFLRRISASDISLNASLLKFTSNLTNLGMGKWYQPSWKVQMKIVDALDVLKADSRVEHQELTSLLKTVGCLDSHELMQLYRNIEDIMLTKYLKKSVKQQAVVLRSRLLEIFTERISQTRTLSPTLSHIKILPRYKAHDCRMGLVEPLLDSLPRLTADKEEVNCLRALRILELSTVIFPVYQSETYENLVSFLMLRPKPLFYASLQLVKALSHSGYMPNNADSFITWAQNLMAEMMHKDILENRFKVEMMFALSLLGIYFDEVLSKIFTLDFILAFEREISELPKHKLEEMKSYLIMLSRNVSLECPHLTLPLLSQNLLSPGYPRIPNTGTVKINSSLGRLCGTSKFVQSNAKSPYNHRIDALMYVESHVSLVLPEDVEAKIEEGTDVERIAILYLNPHHYCCRSEHMIGKTQ